MRLPPLNAVRAFDAVARLGSVRAAADELAVTPAAVSQQLRVLEAHLGLALTQRQGRGLTLTDSGRTWHGEIARHLRAIALAAERVRPGRRVVQVTVVQSFGSRWLMPRLTKFTAREPEIVGIFKKIVGAGPRASGAQWAFALTPAVVAAAVAASAWVLR